MKKMMHPDRLRELKDDEKKYSREEVSRKISDFAKEFSYKNNLQLKDSLDFTLKWISENLI